MQMKLGVDPAINEDLRIRALQAVTLTIFEHMLNDFDEIHADMVQKAKQCDDSADGLIAFEAL